MQILSERSQTTLKEGGITLYPLRITLLDFTDKMRRRSIFSGRSVGAYLRFSFYTNSEQEMKSEPLSKRSQRAARLQSLHECIEKSLALLLE